MLLAIFGYVSENAQFSAFFWKLVPQNNNYFVNANPFIITLSDCFIKQYNGKEEEEQQQQQQQQQAAALAEAMMRQKRW